MILEPPVSSRKNHNDNTLHHYIYIYIYHDYMSVFLSSSNYNTVMYLCLSQSVHVLNLKKNCGTLTTHNISFEFTYKVSSKYF